MKSLIAFLQVLLHEMGERCHTSTTLDWKTIESRTEHEGYSFLTITLPNFGKDLQKALDQGKVDSSLFIGFRRGKGELPRFLGGFLCHVFDPSNGVLLDEPDIDAISAVYQLTLMFAKIELPCSDERVANAFKSFVRCEQEVREADKRLSSSLKEEFKRVSGLLFTPVLTAVDQIVYDGEIVPKHGPGSTADRLSGNRKYDQQEWTMRLEKVFPARENLIPNWGHVQCLERVNFLEPGAERPVRVVAVPKTLKTPRIIAIEPSCMQYMQQGLLEVLVRHLEADNLVSRMIGFTDQLPNREMARNGSLDGSLATLDLSEASDRVSNQHVRLLLDGRSHLFDAVDATRSRKADVPGHGVIRLAKFASMGSALCFPMEAMVFLTVVFMGIAAELNTPLTRKTIRSFHGKVRVYGDDIIVPVEYVSSVVRHLEAFGLKVNASKSFWNGKFRESCGGDYYDGTWITPVRVRRTFPTQRMQAKEIVSMSSLRNQLHAAGYDQSVAWLDERLIALLGRYPFVSHDSPAIGRHTYGHVTVDKVSSDLQTPLVKAWVVTSTLPASKLDGVGALMKFFLKRSDLPFADRKHLELAGRPVSVDIKTRWVSPL